MWRNKLLREHPDCATNEITKWARAYPDGPNGGAHPNGCRLSVEPIGGSHRTALAPTSGRGVLTIGLSSPDENAPQDLARTGREQYRRVTGAAESTLFAGTYSGNPQGLGAGGHEQARLTADAVIPLYSCKHLTPKFTSAGARAVASKTRRNASVNEPALFVGSCSTISQGPGRSLTQILRETASRFHDCRARER